MCANQTASSSTCLFDQVIKQLASQSNSVANANHPPLTHILHHMRQLKPDLTPQDAALDLRAAVTECKLGPKQVLRSPDYLLCTIAQQRLPQKTVNLVFGSETARKKARAAAAKALECDDHEHPHESPDYYDMLLEELFAIKRISNNPSAPAYDPIKKYTHIYEDKFVEITQHPDENQWQETDLDKQQKKFLIDMLVILENLNLENPIQDESS